MGNIYTDSGSYTEVLTNAAGCDSTVTLNLTILQPTEYTLSQSACSSFEWMGNIYTESGSYTEVLNNAAGCDSTVTLNLTIIPVPEIVLSVSTTEISTIIEADEYQWIDCSNNFEEILNATSHQFSPVVSGLYTLQITNDGCEAESECIEFVVNSIASIDIENQIRIINPIEHNTIVLFSVTTLQNLSVYSMDGKIIETLNLLPSGWNKIYLSEVHEGYYFLTAQTQAGQWVSKPFICLH
jgi:hypothetical protein